MLDGTLPLPPGRLGRSRIRPNVTIPLRAWPPLTTETFSVSGRRAQQRSRTAASWGRPEGLSSTATGHFTERTLRGPARVPSDWL